jgi:hypothetical protein
MKWSSYTLRTAAVVQAEIERLNKVLAELLQREGTTVTASNGSKKRAPAERGPGGPFGPAVTASKTFNAEPSTLSAFEFLEEVLFRGNEFSGSETQITQYTPTYCLQVLRRVDSARLLTQLEPL